MKLLIFLGCLIVSISCFFILLTFDSMIRTEFICSFEEKVVCNLTELNFTIVFGILIVGMFLFVDMLVVYLMIKTWVPGVFAYGL
ncbi:MAG: hypothetical protein V3U72_03815 [Candidatus Aenigmarchaeota archaeon]